MLWAPTLLLVCLLNPLMGPSCSPLQVEAEASDLFKQSKEACETHTAEKAERVLTEHDMTVISVMVVCERRHGV